MQSVQRLDYELGHQYSVGHWRQVIILLSFYLSPSYVHKIVSEDR